MVVQLDIQTPIFSSYKGMNKFWYKFLVKDESVTITSEIQADLKEFVENALQYFDEYNIPKLECELPGHHLENLCGALCHLGKAPLDMRIRSGDIPCYSPGMEQPPDELTSEQERVEIDINNKIRRELARFPRFDFLEHAFDDNFHQNKRNP